MPRIVVHVEVSARFGPFHNSTPRSSAEPALSPTSRFDTLIIDTVSSRILHVQGELFCLHDLKHLEG